MWRSPSLIVGLGTVTGFLLGYQLLTSVTALEDGLFRGSFSVKAGDNFTPILSRVGSEEFAGKSEKYQKLIDKIYSQSPVKDGYLGSEVIEFKEAGKGSLSVTFNIRLNTRELEADAGDLLLIFSENLRDKSGSLNKNIIVDQESLEIWDVGEVPPQVNEKENVTTAINGNISRVVE